MFDSHWWWVGARSQLEIATLWPAVGFLRNLLTSTHNFGWRDKLATLLRGQRGSDHAMADPVATGARLLVLTTALGQPDISEAEIGPPLTWRAVPPTATWRT